MEQLNKMATLMAQTITLAAIDSDSVKLIGTEMVRHNTLKATVHCADADLPLVLGGRGANAKAVREIAIYGCPAGQMIELHLQSDHPEAGDRVQPRERREFGKAAELGDTTVDRICGVVGNWHVACGGRRPKITVESTSRSDVFLVHDRTLPGAVMKGLRRVVGWACKIRGRHGFIEWED